MNTSDPIKSGIHGLDLLVDHIRFGDNVVFRLSHLDLFKRLVKPFVKQALEDKRTLVYIRFAEHEALVEPQEGIKIIHLNPAEGFEKFTVMVHEAIADAGEKAFYVFDCLSGLQEAWSTDLMMGNFFRVTCPYLAKLDTVAYFPLLRGMHSFEAVSRIRETTQLFLDVYQNEQNFYLQPLKVCNRYNGNMFQPHLYNHQSGLFEPLLDGLTVSQFYETVDADESNSLQHLDSWDRYFTFLRIQYTKNTLPEKEFKHICNIMMTHDENMASMIAENFSPRDYFIIRNRMIGTGMLGGKACGMLLARKLIQKSFPEFRHRLEPHDSYYVGSDVFYTYIVANNCWDLRIKQRQERASFCASSEFGQKLRDGKFPENIRIEFRRMLDYFGQSPIIVRSSSFLEDSFGNAFAGKYESVFCVNVGEMETRLAAFEDAVKTVYASTMNASALEYRRTRDLLDCDEQMALLVQRVSGSKYDPFFMPLAAGVGYSYNAYQWLKDLDPHAGMLRLVMGLGTRAVDRTATGYPRIISLDRPTASTYTTTAERHRFSQSEVDVLDLTTNTLTTKNLKTVIPVLERWQKNTVLSHDTEAETLLRARGDRREILFADCQGLTKNTEFTNMMQKILAMLEKEYGNPVDIEFTVNFSESGDFVVNILQCRPLQVCISDPVSLPKHVNPDEVLFDLSKSAMGRSRDEKIDFIITVDPQAYYEFPYAQKDAVAHQIGKINQHFKDYQQNILLMVPGRIGTSSKELGLPVTYADISNFNALCEVAYRQAGYNPELSYGSHIFQDLVEADIFYGALLEDPQTTVYHPDRLMHEKEIYASILAPDEAMQKIIKVYDVSEKNLQLTFDMLNARAICRFEPPRIKD